MKTPNILELFGGVDIELKNNFKNKEGGFNKVYRQLLFKVLFVVFIYTTVGFLGYLLFDYLLVYYAGRHDLIAKVVEWIDKNGWIGTLIYIVVGYGIILLYFWKKPFQYLTEVLNATESIFLHKEDIIVLPSALKDTEVFLNQLRMLVQKNDHIVQELGQQKINFITSLAHDLKTPLTSVIGYLSLLQEAPDMPVEQKAKYVNITLNKAQRLEQLINEFFEFTRYNLQCITLECESIDLYYMLIQLTDEFFPALSAHGNTINLIANEELTVFGDPGKLARVFSNILKNAISYSYPCTEIIVEAKIIDKFIEIAFINHGKTIPPSKLDYIFDRFFRIDETCTSEEGVGLGLAIAKEIVSLHKGRILAKSENDVTTFYISLPISEL